ncbi:MAG: apolipoprotein N-acyltransferase [Gammaproteobacteria bacterium]
MTSRRAALLPALSLLLTGLCLPPFNLWPLALVQWVPLLWFCARVDAASAGLIGAMVGAACGLHVFFGASVLDPWTLMLACGALALGHGVFFLAASRLLSHSSLFAPLLLACLWVAIEQLFTLALLPFSIAVTLTPAPATLQAAALGGQSLVVFLLLSMQTTLVAFLLHPNDLNRVRFALTSIIVASSISFSGAVHQVAVTSTLRVAAIQTDLHPYHYTFSEADGQLDHLSQHRAQLEQLLRAEPPSLSVWPEVVFGRYEWRAPGAYTHRPVGPSLFAGNDLDMSGRKYNAVFGVDSAGDVVSRHVKSTLLPRMEAQYSPAQDPLPHLVLPGAPGSLICFESAFASTAVRLSKAGAQFLSIATSDAYAGPAILSRLHAAFTQLRAIENRRAVVRAANGGPSMIVLPSGKVVQQMGQFVHGVLRHEIPLSTELSLYTSTRLFWSIGFAVLALAALAMALSVPPHEDVIALPPHWGRTTSSLLLVAVTLIVTQLAWVSREHRLARDATSNWPGMGFHREITDGPDYAGISSDQESSDLPAVVAAAARRFGINVATADVTARLEELRSKSIHRISARDLFASYDLATVSFPGNTSDSALPCAASLTDGSTVLITRRFDTAAQIFEPSNEQYTSVPWAWLNTSFAEPPVCVSGRTYGWDLQ